MKLGVFDSGIGGEAVAASLKLEFPNAEIVTANDRGNVPYGSKPAELVKQLTDTAIQPLLSSGCDIIILACNTATAVAIEFLRVKYPNQKFIGLEPMIKTAASLTRSGTVAICATPATLASDRYAKLKNKFAGSTAILEPDCSSWAFMIEHNQINHGEIKSVINSVCEQNADIIVLGCTHYHWIKELITKLAAGRAQVIDPSAAIAARVRELLL